MFIVVHLYSSYREISKWKKINLRVYMRREKYMKYIQIKNIYITSILVISISNHWYNRFLYIHWLFYNPYWFLSRISSGIITVGAKGRSLVRIAGANGAREGIMSPWHLRWRIVPREAVQGFNFPISRTVTLSLAAVRPEYFTRFGGTPGARSPFYFFSGTSPPVI